MDVNQDEVRRTFARYRVDCIIHGHTHRPAVHECRSTATRPCASCSATGTSKAACCAGMSAALSWLPVGRASARLRCCRAKARPTRGDRSGTGTADPATSPARLRFPPAACSRARQSLARARCSARRRYNRLMTRLRLRQPAIEVAQRLLQTRRETHEALARARFDQRAAQQQVEQPPRLRSSRRARASLRRSATAPGARTARRARCIIFCTCSKCRSSSRARRDRRSVSAILRRT